MKKEEVLKIYEKEKANILEVFPSLSADWSYFKSIESAIEGYYTNTADVSESMRNVIRGMVSQSTKAGMKCAKDEELGIKYPDKGDTDIVGRLYKWECLSLLVEKVKYSVVETDTYSIDTDYTVKVDAEQPELDAVIAEINGARAEEKTKLDAMAESYWQGCSKTDFMCILENRGEVITVPSKEDIVKTIYIDNGILEQVKEFDVYVPTYLR